MENIEQTPKTTMKNKITFEDKKWEGTLLTIRTYPDPVLKKVALPVEEFNEELATLCHNMIYTMYMCNGIGLAGPQIGLSQRIFVIDVDYNRQKVIAENGEEETLLTNMKPQIFINPVYRNTTDKKIMFQEGCLSLPEVYDDVERFESIVVDYLTPQGEPQTLEAKDLLSICIQHEYDHIEGIVFIERLSQLKKKFYAKKLTKDKKRHAEAP